MDKPTEHPLWPVFLKWLELHATWSFVGRHRDNDTLSLWSVFLAGAEAEQTRVLNLT